MKDTIIKDQQQTIERLQTELKEKSETIDKQSKLINSLQNVIDIANMKATEKIKKHLALFNDPYFKGLSIEQIIELAKKSIRLTDDNCKMRHKLEDIADLYDDSELSKKIKKIICRED